MSRRSANEWLEMLQKRLQRIHRFEVVVEPGTDVAIHYLSKRGGEAVTIPMDTGATILFRDTTPSISAVLEEFAHVLQHVRQHFSDLDLREVLCRREIEVKDCLMRNQEQLGIPLEEHLETVAQLDGQRLRLAQLERSMR